MGMYNKEDIVSFFENDLNKEETDVLIGTLSQVEPTEKGIVAKEGTKFHQLLHGYMDNLKIEDENYIVSYWLKILKREIAVSKYVKTVVKRIYEDFKLSLEDENYPYYLDHKAGMKPINFLQNIIPVSIGDFKDESSKVQLMLWQKFLLYVLFGFKNKETKKRKYIEVLILIARKNGKSFLSAMVMLYMAVMEDEGEPQLVTASSKYQQARLIYNMVYNIISKSDELSAVIDSNKEYMTIKESLGTIKALSGDSKTQDGLNLQGLFIDELHAIEDENLYNVLKESMVQRTQPIIFITTTFGYDMNPLFEKKVKEAKTLIDEFDKGTRNAHDSVIKEVSETMLPLIYALDDEEEWKDEEKWEKANPSLNEALPINLLREAMYSNLIKETDDEETKVSKMYNLRANLSKHFNLYKSSQSSWLDYDVIRNDITFKDEDLYKVSEVVGGIDMGLTNDLTSANILFKVNGSDYIYVKHMYFMTKASLEERIRIDKVPYDIWVEKGYLRLHEGMTMTHLPVISWFKEMKEEYGFNINYIGYDRFNTTGIKNNIEDILYDESKLIDIAQVMRELSAPMKSLESVIRHRKLNYQNNPMTLKHMVNTQIKISPEGHIQPMKARGKIRYKIDGLASMLNSYHVYLNHITELDDKFLYNENFKEEE